MNQKPSNETPLTSKEHGFFAAAYFGGRAEVRVRMMDVPVVVADVTSMYPTVFILLHLQQVLASKSLWIRDATEDTQRIIDGISLSDLERPETWQKLNRLVLVEPYGDMLPVRWREPLPGEDPSGPFTIAISPYTCRRPCWYTLADVIAAKIRSGRIPKVLRAIEVIGHGQKRLTPVSLRKSFRVDPNNEIFKTIVERRQRTKRARENNPNSEDGRLDLSLKEVANVCSYGMFAEVNVIPSLKGKRGHWYSDEDEECEDVGDERPGPFTNFVFASLITGAARLLLAMLEQRVIEAGGTFAYCDTDSLAIVAGENCPQSVPCLKVSQVHRILQRFDVLNPYDLKGNLIKVEHEMERNLRCFAVSAKRYVLYTISETGRIRIVKPSESALGAIVGRKERENTKKLARRVWLSILSQELPMPKAQQRRIEQLCEFGGIPLRRKLPVTQPPTFARFNHYNMRKAYSQSVKPFNFVQAFTVPEQSQHEDIHPVMPFESNLAKCRKLPCIDVKTGDPIAIDWDRNGWAGAVSVLSLAEYVEQFRRHPEAKAADSEGNPCTEETRGLLFSLPLESDGAIRIGKEVDRLDEDEGTSLDNDGPLNYDAKAKRKRVLCFEGLWSAVEYLAQFPQGEIAKGLGISERRWRDILKRKSTPRRKTQRAIVSLAMEYPAERFSSSG